MCVCIDDWFGVHVSMRESFCITRYIRDYAYRIMCASIFKGPTSKLDNAFIIKDLYNDFTGMTHIGIQVYFFIMPKKLKKELSTE